MNITSGKIQSAQKCCVYGPEGIGKSTFAAQFPDPLFIDTEGSTKHLDVRRFDKPTSWAMLQEQVKYVVANPSVCRTLIIDTADWAERLCVEAVCAHGGVNGIEGFGYGKGYTYLQEEFGRLLNALEEVVQRGVHVLLTAHAATRKLEQPDEIGSYDHWELKLTKKVGEMIKEWADLILFATYKTRVVKGDEKKGEKNKAQGGLRVMHTTHHPAWDAKNRHGLAEELPLDYKVIQHIFDDPLPKLAERAQQLQKDSASCVAPPSGYEAAIHVPGLSAIIDDVDNLNDGAPAAATPAPVPSSMHQKLHDLMQASGVQEFELRAIVSDKGTFPEDMPIADYPEDFIKEGLIPRWQSIVMPAITAFRESLPFK